MLASNATGESYYKPEKSITSLQFIGTETEYARKCKWEKGDIPGPNWVQRVVMCIVCAGHELSMIAK